MLKLINNTTIIQTNDNINNIKCAEVFCKNAKSFSIVCTFCEMKIFEFTEFLQHFRNVHYQDDARLKDELNVADTAIYDELDSEMDGPQLLIKTLNDYELVVEDEEATDADNSEHDDDDDEEYQPKVFKHDGENLHCMECSKTYKTRGAFKRHITEVHGIKGKPHKCDTCDKDFARQSLLQEHQRIEHGIVKRKKKSVAHACPDCDKVYTTGHCLRIHRYIHTGERNFVCDFKDCGKKFSNPDGLRTHKRTVHFNDKLVCEICGKSTKRKKDLMIHKLVHTGEKPHACKICGKAFRTDSLLREHHPVHSTARPHVCDVCGATFSRPKGLYHHKHLHLAVKKFVCKLCGKSYAQAAGLCGHMRKHRNDINGIESTK